MRFLTLCCSLVFLSALTAVGLWHARRVKTGEDFALAGRRLPVGVLFGTLVATWIGTGSLFGNAEFAYEHGLAALLLPAGGAVGIVFLSMLAGRARSLPADSVPQILRLRFGRAAQLLGAIALIGAYLIIVSYQYRAGAGILGYIFPDAGSSLRDFAARWFPTLSDSALDTWNKAPGVIGVGFFIILYTMLAGMVSVAWTDVLNGVLMAVGLFAALGIMSLKFFSMDRGDLPVISELQQPIEPVSFISWIGYLLPPLLLVLGDANLYQRFMSARSPEAARRGAILMFFGVLIMEWTIILLACLGRQLLPEEPAIQGGAIIAIAFTLLPEWLGVLLVMSAVAVVITTADSYLLGSATSVSADLVGKLTTAGRQRAIALVLGLLAMGLAFVSDQFFSVAMYAYTIYGATLTPAVVCALVWPRVPRAAIVSGMSVGLLTAICWKAGLVYDWVPAAVSHVEPVLASLTLHVTVLCGLTAWIGLTKEQA